MDALELNSHKIIEGNDWADNVSEEEDTTLLEGLKQESNGQVKSHDEILEKHRKQFPYLHL
jgi:hypothetical protein